jgi:hypothetical protein
VPHDLRQFKATAHVMPHETRSIEQLKKEAALKALGTDAAAKLSRISFHLIPILQYKFRCGQAIFFHKGTA